MKVIHLSSSNYGGAYSAALKLHKLTKSMGYDSVIYFKYALTKPEISPDYIVQNKFLGFIKNAKAKLRNKLPYFLKQRVVEKEKSMSAFYSFFQRQEHIESGINAKLVNSIHSADVLVVHWITGFVNFYDIRAIQEKTKCRVIFTMMDMAHITGGCHYSQGCALFQSNCINCPALNYNEKSIAPKQLLSKSIVAASIKAEIIAFSKEDYYKAQSSVISFSKYHHMTLFYDKHIFKPGVSNQSNSNKKSYNLLGSAFTIHNERKGPSYFLQVLILLDQLVESLVEIIVYHIDLNFESKHQFRNIKFQKFNYIKDESDLAQLYNNTDVVVFTSIADAAAQMMAESLMCGTPVVSFDTGNAKEIIQNGYDGFVVDKYDCKNMAYRIYESLFNPPSTFLSREDRHDRAVQNHNEDQFTMSLKNILDASDV